VYTVQGREAGGVHCTVYSLVYSLGKQEYTQYKVGKQGVYTVQGREVGGVHCTR